MRTNRFWICLLGAVALASVCGHFLLGQAKGTHAGVYQDGGLLLTVDINAQPPPDPFMIEYGRGFNVITVEKGRIRVSEANCPDGLCVRQGWLENGRMPITCLPHRLVIRLENPGKEGFDGITG